MKKFNKITIIIPVYQPIESLSVFVNELNKTFNVIIINDGSDTSLNYIFDSIKKTCEDVVILKHCVNQGKGRAIKTALNYILCNDDSYKPDAIITVDADGQHSICDIYKMAETLNEMDSNSILFGCRKFSGNNIPARSKIGNIISKYLYSWACNIQLSDTQTGLRGLPYSFYKKALAIDGERYEYETNMLVAAKDLGFNFVEIPIQTIYEDNNSVSHFNPIKDSIRIYRVLFKYLFSSLASVCCDYLAFSLLFYLFGFSIIISTYLARFISCILNFTVNRNFVFNDKGRTLSQFIKYFLLVLVSGTISGYLVTFLSERGGYVLLLKVVVELILFIFNYCIQRKFIFNKKVKK